MKSYRKKFPWKQTWMKINRRCNNPKDSVYKYYGGRGIQNLITEEELKLLWCRDNAVQMKRPSIDRIDNNGNYTFDNCRYIEQRDNSIKSNKERKNYGKSNFNPCK